MMKFDLPAFLQSLNFMWQGMLGIFLVTAVILLCIFLLNRLTGKFAAPKDAAPPEPPAPAAPETPAAPPEVTAAVAAALAEAMGTEVEGIRIASVKRL